MALFKAKAYTREGRYEYIGTGTQEEVENKLLKAIETAMRDNGYLSKDESLTISRDAYNPETLHDGEAIVMAGLDYRRNVDNKDLDIQSIANTMHDEKEDEFFDSEDMYRMFFPLYVEEIELETLYWFDD